MHWFHNITARLLIVGCVIAAAFPITASGQDLTKSLQYRQQFAQAVRNATKRVLPSVVSIEAIGVAQTGGRRRSELEQDAPTSGLIVDPSGLVVASDIILRRSATSLLVVMPDQTRFAAKTVARDHHRGVVLLRINSKDPLPAVNLPDRDQLPVGSTVIGVGRYGIDQAPMVSSGILSARGRLKGTMLQCDARISPTFYGGPLIDLGGNVVGLSVPAVPAGGAPDATSWYDSGIAFAVPADVIANKLDRMREGQDIHKGLLGIVPRSKDPLAEDTALGAVRLRSPAEQAGLEVGDEITAIAGTPVKMFSQIEQALGPFDAGDKIAVSFKRGDKTTTVDVVLADKIDPLEPQRLGIWVDQTETLDDADDAQQQQTVTIEAILPESAAEGKLQANDVLLKLDDTEIRDVTTLRKLLITAAPDTEIQATITRDGKEQTVAVKPTSIGGKAITEALPQWKPDAEPKPWEVQALRLPDAPNLAALTMPSEDQLAALDQQATSLAMLIVLLPPDEREPEKALENWQALAAKQGVVVCAVSCESEKGWESKEIDVVARFVSLMLQRVTVGSIGLATYGVTNGDKTSSADTLAIAMGLSDRSEFNGIAVSAKTKPPAVRLRENQPESALRLLLPIGSPDDAPTWSTPLQQAGYPIETAGELNRTKLLNWVRLLQII